MFQSMTGYGQSFFENQDFQAYIAIRSLNGKILDIHFQAPCLPFLQEMQWRTKLSHWLKRGNILVTIVYTPKATNLSLNLDPNLFKKCYAELKAMVEQLSTPPLDLFALALRKHDALLKQPACALIPETQCGVLDSSFEQAIQECIHSRKAEGKALQQQLIFALDELKTYLQNIVLQDPQRLAEARQKLATRVKDLEILLESDPKMTKDFLYTLEKMDITEEKTRILQHLQYFEQVLTKEAYAGRKLGFIVQELSREIHTLGAKAVDLGMQQQVIGMKETLETIKEQLYNVL